jgi:colanic acid/amylovoran biosynthesis protein
MPPLRIGFAWQTLTSENLGVCALAEAHLHIARRAAARVGRSVSAIEFCPTGPSRALADAQGCEIADPLSPRRMLLGQSRYAAQLAACDAVLDIGAGDSLSDIYGFKHFGFLALSKWLALRAGVPLVLAPQTMGPFQGRVARRIVAHLLRRATRVFARDGLSMAWLREQGLDARAEEVIDVAFRLPFAARPAPEDGAVHVGLNVSGLLYNGGYTRNNQFGLKTDYRALVDRLVAIWSARPGLVLHLVGHVNSQQLPVEDDYAVCEALAARHAGVVLAPRFASPGEAKGYISGLHFFSGARMHACIAAFSSGVPVLPMAYSRKFNGLFGSLGYPHLVDLKADDTDAALARLEQGLAQREALATEVAAGNALAQRKLQRYEDYLAELFGTLGHARR